MSPIATLRKEHRKILQMLDCLDLQKRCIRRGETVDPEDLRGLVRFFDEYADKQHHAKEEGLFFPALEAHGLPHDRGPIAVMLHDHVYGRDIVLGMQDAVSEESLTDEHLQAFAGFAARFVPMLREQIAKEDHVLFRMAEDALPLGVLANSGPAFDRVIDEAFGRERFEELEALVQRLATKYEIDEPKNADNLPSAAAG